MEVGAQGQGGLSLLESKPDASTKNPNEKNSLGIFSTGGLGGGSSSLLGLGGGSSSLTGFGLLGSMNSNNDVFSGGVFSKSTSQNGLGEVFNQKLLQNERKEETEKNEESNDKKGEDQPQSKPSALFGGLSSGSPPTGSLLSGKLAQEPSSPFFGRLERSDSTQGETTQAVPDNQEKEPEKPKGGLLIGTGGLLGGNNSLDSLKTTGASGFGSLIGGSSSTPGTGILGNNLATSGSSLFGGLTTMNGGGVLGNGSTSDGLGPLLSKGSGNGSSGGVFSQPSGLGIQLGGGSGLQIGTGLPIGTGGILGGASQGILGGSVGQGENK